MITLKPPDLDLFTKEAAQRNETDLSVLAPDEKTDATFGSSPGTRRIKDYLDYGFIVLDKPQGPTSHEVVAWVRKMLSQDRAGHSGTLDPMVSGLLPIGLGEATKALSVLLLGPKEYICVARIHDSIPKEILYDAIAQFTGPIYQKPPQRSSVKRVTRTRTIYMLEVMEQVGNLLLIRVLSEAGTYIRKLVYDIGEVLGVGATMVELRRTRVCHLDETDMVRLHDLYESNEVFKESAKDSRLRDIIRPVEYAVSFLKQIKIRDSAVESVCQGAQLAVPGIVAASKGIKKGEIVRIMSLKGELVAIAEAQLEEAQILAEEHGLATITKRVIMKPGSYPKMWKSKKEVVVENEGISEALLKKSILDSLEKDEREENEDSK